MPWLVQNLHLWTGRASCDPRALPAFGLGFFPQDPLSTAGFGLAGTVVSRLSHSSHRGPSSGGSREVQSQTIFPPPALRFGCPWGLGGDVFQGNDGGRHPGSEGLPSPGALPLPENGCGAAFIGRRKKPGREHTWESNFHFESTYYAPGHRALFYSNDLFGSSQKFPVRQVVLSSLHRRGN